jgi:hypothetical protein
MPTTLPTQRGIEAAATTPMPTVDATLDLSARTLSWLAQRPQARLVVDSVWDTLTELEAAGHHRRLLAAVRFVLATTSPPRRGDAELVAG